MIRATRLIGRRQTVSESPGVENGAQRNGTLRDVHSLRFVREVANGRRAIANYEIVGPAEAGPSTESITANAGPLVSTYLLQLPGDSGTLGFRWNRFPTAVVFQSHGTEPGAAGGGLTSLQRGLGAWTNDAGSNINYQYGGATSAPSTHFFDSNPQPDGVNSIQFNDPSNEIPGSYHGQGGDTLAIGGAWAATSGPNSTHTFSGETFYTITEAAFSASLLWYTMLLCVIDIPRSGVEKSSEIKTPVVKRRTLTASQRRGSLPDVGA